MGWRLMWLLVVERDDDGGGSHWPRLVRFAVVGLAVIGIVGVLVWRGVA